MTEKSFSLYKSHYVASADSVFMSYLS